MLYLMIVNNKLYNYDDNNSGRSIRSWQDFSNQSLRIKQLRDFPRTNHWYDILVEEYLLQVADRLTFANMGYSRLGQLFEVDDKSIHQHFLEECLRSHCNV